MTKFYLGYKWNTRNGKVTKRQTIDISKFPHVSIISPTGASKGVSIEIPQLLTGMRDCSVINIDNSGQNWAVCAAARLAINHEVLTINPTHLNEHLYPDLKPVGFNPMAGIDVSKPVAFRRRSKAIAEAIAGIKKANGDGKFFETGAQMLCTGLIMYVKLRDGDNANLGAVRDLLCEPEEVDGDGRSIKGLRATAARAVATGHRGTANLMGRFMHESRSNRDIISTLHNDTLFLDDADIRAALSDDGLDFSTLKDMPPKTVFVITPPNMPETDSAPFLRVIVNCGLDSLYQRGADGLPVTLMISEAAHIGRLENLIAAAGQIRKYKVRLAPIVWQALSQAVSVYGENDAKTLISNSGTLLSFNSGNDADTAEFLSRLSGERWSLALSAGDDPLHGNLRGTASGQRERTWTATDLRNLPERHALVWRTGRAEPVPVYCPPYWDIKACRRVARPDPYHGEMPRRQTGRHWGLKAACLAVASVFLAGAWWGYGDKSIPAEAHRPPVIEPAPVAPPPKLPPSPVSAGPKTLPRAAPPRASPPRKQPKARAPTSRNTGPR